MPPAGAAIIGAEFLARGFCFELLIDPPMNQSVIAYLLLLLFVAVVRLAELQISARNQRRMGEKGVAKVSDPVFRWMVLLHLAVLISAALEVIFLHRPLILPLAAVSLAVLAFSILLRWWVIRTLASHWNVQVMASTSLGVVTSGPYSGFVIRIIWRYFWNCWQFR